MSELVGRISEAWSDASRAAALEARRKKRKFGVNIHHENLSGFDFSAAETKHALYARDANGRLVGALAFSRKEDPEDYYLNHIKIQSLEVNPRVRRQGVGSQLMAEMKRLFPVEGDHAIDHGGFTPEGAAFHKATTGEDVKPTKRLDRADRQPHEWFEGAVYDTPPKLVPYRKKKK